MPKISVQHQSSLPAAEALDKIKNFFETDKDLQRIDPGLKCDFNPSNMKGQVHGKQFKADVTVSTQSPGCSVSVIIDLPLILTPFKGKVEETVKRKLSKYLA